MSEADHYEELERLRKQQQDRIAIDIAEARQGVERIERHMAKMREEFARAETLRDVDFRVRKIEVSWGKLVGVCLAIQLFGGGIIAVLTLFKK